MDYNYHTHTYRCSHATGTEEEYVLRAIEGGIKYMGFSDHIPFKEPDGTELFYRVPVAEAKDHCDEILRLKEKYKDQIEITLGFEMEYYAPYFNDMLKNAISYGAEYLILGQHFILPAHYTGTPTDDAEKLKTYVDWVIEAMNTGVFTYLAHPDVMHFTGDVSVYQKEMRRICVESTRRNMPLEVNLLGIRENRHYPTSSFWEIAGEEKCPVTFGFDAHDTPSAFDGASIPKAKELVQKYGLNYIGKPNLVDIQKL